MLPGYSCKAPATPGFFHAHHVPTTTHHAPTTTHHVPTTTHHAPERILRGFFMRALLHCTLCVHSP